MCTSALHRVVAQGGPGWVLARDVAGRASRVSLLALDPPRAGTGEWLVVLSGYAVDRAPDPVAEQAMQALGVLEPGPVGCPDGTDSTAGRR